MKNNTIDKYFREKTELLKGLPEGINWNVKKGWHNYQKLYSPIKRNLSLSIIIGSAAAAVIIAVLIVVLNLDPNGKYITVNNSSSGIKEVALPDGNKVWLSRNSTIEYPENTTTDDYSVTISGEAYFEIKNKTIYRYMISAHNALIVPENYSSFNIHAPAGEDCVNITVASGALKISEESIPRGIALLVTQGNYCSVHKSRKLVYVAANTNNNYLAWKTGKLFFEQQPLASVTDILASYFGVEIELESKSLAYCLYSGSFDNRNIETILNRMQNDLDLEFTTANNKILISGKGCLKPKT
jgi:transmembrane sensor